MDNTNRTTPLIISSEEGMDSLSRIPLVTLLIPTILGRETYLSRLISILNPQLSKYDGEVIALVNKDNREKSIGAKRNELIDLAVKTGAKYRAFIDDDDTVTDDYIDLNIEGARGGYDTNSLRGIYSINGYIDPRLNTFIHSIKYKTAWQDHQFYYRPPNHLNWTLLEKVADLKYKDDNFGEDMTHAEIIASEGRLLSEYNTGIKPMYHYLDRTKVNGI